MRINEYILIIIALFLPVMLQSQVLNWGYVVGSSGTEKTNDVAIDSENNVVSVGEFNGTFDIDPSSNVLNLSSIVTEGFIVKYTQSGDLIWAIEFNAEPTGFAYVLSVEIDNNDNIYALLLPNLNVDIDPSSNVVNVSHLDAMIIVKYDKNGNYISHVGSIGLTGGAPPSMTIDKNNNLYVYSSFTGSFDIDPTATTQTLTSNGAIDWFISKYNSNLNFEFAFSFGGANNEYGNSIHVDSLLNIYIVGRYEGTVDFDPSVSVNSLTAISGYDAFLTKYNSNGQFQFAKSFSGTDDQELFDVRVYDNKIYVCGGFEVNIDTDPNAGITQYTIIAPQTGTDIWFGRYSIADGSLDESWHIVGGGTFASVARKIRFDEWGNIYLGLLTWGDNDYDMSSGTYNINSSLYDIGFAKYSNSGDFIWAGIMYGGEIDGISNMEIDEDYNLIVSGNVRTNSINLSINGGTENRAGINAENLLLVSYSLKVPPTVRFTKIYESKENTIDGLGTLISNGNSEMQSLGAIVSESSNPNFSNMSSISIASKDSSNFYFKLENLFSNTEYYVRTFGINETDTSYGDIYLIKTKPTAEDSGPNNGDGNGDGIKDSRQSAVHTFKSLNEHYITLVSKTNKTIYDVRTRTTTNTTYYYPYQMFEFKINATIDTVRIYLHNTNLDSNAKYIKLNKEKKLIDYAIITKGIDTIGENIVKYIEIELKDGGYGDYDGLENGIIHDPAGIAVPFITSNIPSLSEWARIFLYLLLISLGIWKLRRLS